MGKITIKFWNTEKKKYDEHWDYYLDEDMSVFSFENTSYENYMREIPTIEPHFYKDGERI